MDIFCRRKDSKAHLSIHLKKYSTIVTSMDSGVRWPGLSRPQDLVGDGHQTLMFFGKSPSKPLKGEDGAMSYSCCRYNRPDTSLVFNKCFIAPL